MKGAEYALHGARVRLTRRGLSAGALLAIDVVFRLRTPTLNAFIELAVVLAFILTAVCSVPYRTRRGVLLAGVLGLTYGVFLPAVGVSLPTVALASLTCIHTTLLFGRAAGLGAAVATSFVLAFLTTLGAPFLPQAASHSAGLALLLLGSAFPVVRFVEELTSATQARLLALRDTLAEELRRDEALRTHRLAQEELRGAQRERTLGRLAGGLAHEINSVLQEVQGWIEVLREAESLGRPNLREAVVEMRDAVLRAASVGRRLLYVGGQNLSATRPTNLRGYFEKVRPTITAAAGANVSLIVEVLETGAVEADPSELTHALVNLIMNSRDALKGDGSITITVRPASESDKKVLENAAAVVSVIDNGPGIPQNIRERIFEPFFTTKGKRGTGLGLATVKRLVEGAGGAVSVHSAKGIGTSVLLYLPRSDKPAEFEERVRRPSLRVRAPVGDTQPIVLFVEDQVSIRNVFERIIPRAGIRLLLAESVDVALEILEGVRPDLIWSDAIMPGRPTQELIDYAQRRGIPIVICSGHVQEELLRRDIRAGDIEFVPKPYAAKDLIERAQRARLGELRAPSPPTLESLPVTMRSEAELAASQSPAGPPSPKPEFKSERPPRPVRLRILLADDDGNVRRSLKRGLERLDFEVTEASDGVEAEKAFREQGPFDVVVLDANMPGLNGPEAAQAIKELSPNTPTALCTGLGFEPGQKLPAVDEIFLKPIALGELAARLRSICDQSSRLAG